MSRPAWASHLGRDLPSSLVVFLVALPLCLGIAIASGVPPAAGLITGVIGGIIVGTISGSPLMVSGPAAGMAVLVFELVRAHGLMALGPVVLLSGLFQLAAAAFRLGAWFRIVSPAVVNGMLAGIGILIIASQLHVMFDAPPMAKGMENFAAFPAVAFAALTKGTGLVAGALGLATLLMMVAWDRFKPGKLKLLPGALIAIVAVTAVAQWLALPVARVTLPEDITSVVGLPGSEFFALFRDPAIWGAALMFAFIASAETLLSAAAVDRMHDGERTRYDRELMAQGVGNSLCGALGALPMTGVIVRSAANVQAGAKSRASTVLHGLWLLGFVLLLPWLLRMTPIAALAGVLVFTGIKMINPKQLQELSEYGRGTLAVFALTALTIVATDLLVGVLTGFAASLLRLALRAAWLRLRLRETEPGQWCLRLVGYATFPNVPRLSRLLDQVPPTHRLFLDIQHLRHIDHACLVLLRDWRDAAQRAGGALIVDDARLESRAEGDDRRVLIQVMA